KLGGFEIAGSIFTRPTQVTHRFILYLRHVDRGEVSRAHASCQFDGIPAVGLNPIAWFCGEQRRCGDPADMAFRKIERAYRENITFMALMCGMLPAHSTVAAFVSSM